MSDTEDKENNDGEQAAPVDSAPNNIPEGEEINPDGDGEGGSVKFNFDGAERMVSDPELRGMGSIISSSNVYYERLPMLEVVFDRLVRLMTTSLRNFTGDNVEVGLESISSIRFGDYVNTIPSPAMVNVFIAEEWDNHGIVMVDNDLIYTMIDVLLGGRRGNALMRVDNRYFTTIERNLVEKLVVVFLGDLSAAFDPLCPITFRFDRLETNPKFASISRPTNVAVLVRLSIQMDSRGGSIELVIPYATIEPIREILLQTFMGEKFGRDSIWESHLIRQLTFTDFELSAILDEVAADLDDVLKWKVGSQLMLNATPDSPVKVVCEGHPLFIGQVGRKAGNIAVKIDGIINHEEA